MRLGVGLGHGNTGNFLVQYRFRDLDVSGRILSACRISLS